MTILTVVKQDGETETFDDAIGHQIGNGAVQVMINDGSQKVFNNFKEVYVDLDEEEKADFKRRIDEAEAVAKARMDAEAGSSTKEVSKLEAVPLNS